MVNITPFNTQPVCTYNSRCTQNLSADDLSNTANATPMDLSLYLVTSPVAEIERTVRQAIDNGVTLVQLREKAMGTGAFITRAQRLHAITRSRGVPLIVNDRVDICLAMDAEGVHIGNDDMDPLIARKLIGNRILGVTVHSLDELKTVVSLKCADYVGIGPLYSTSTKKLDCQPIGTEGVKEMMQWMHENNVALPSVLISGIDEHVCDNVVLESTYQTKRPDGVAVVSCIMASMDPGSVSRIMRAKMDSIYHTRWIDTPKSRSTPPMIHHLTNDAVKNFSANVTLAIGGSPIMASEPMEFPELVLVTNSALVLNTGTLNHTLLSAGLKCYTHAGKHVVFDPVAIGASRLRQELNLDLFKENTPSVVKGNQGEIITLVKLAMGGNVGSAAGLMRGADSTADLPLTQLHALVKPFCDKFGCVVVVTGATDLIVHRQTVCVEGGDAMVTRVTGTGCALSSVIATFIADTPLASAKVFDRVVDAVACYKHCAKRAEARGTGSFMVSFLDELSNVHGSLDCDVYPLNG